MGRATQETENGQVHVATRGGSFSQGEKVKTSFTNKDC